ncbi:MAG TPA: VIT1/CCC1 transporter family protein [Gemmatimonadaceae bacterium]|jgi:VIT1/CCC1 family predicted Fe2+/Mn2+ transporter|nr:VIT1/CCC1 transporter family protein [Gemmatimonadaceae bacterium]
MPAAPHAERHSRTSETVHDVVIGMSDGLTVPFALAAGLSGAMTATRVVITAGLAEVAAGSIAMGLGGYLAARGDAEHYGSELAREEREIADQPETEVAEVAAVFRGFGLSEAEAAPVLRAFQQRPEVWRDFMMRFELGLESPEPGRALRSAMTIAGAYIVGGMVPLFPYFLAANIHQALLVSIVVTLLALLCFGYVKAMFTGAPRFRGAVQTVLIGGLAAGAAFAIARAIT